MSGGPQGVGGAPTGGAATNSVAITTRGNHRDTRSVALAFEFRKTIQTNRAEIMALKFFTVPIKDAE